MCTDIGSGDHTFPDVRLTAGRYFGERSLISNEPRAANVVALEDVTLLSLNGQNFQALLGGLNSRMAAAAVEEDEVLKSSSKGSLMSRFMPASKSGWTFTSRPDIQLDALQEVARLGSGSFGFVRLAQFRSRDVFAFTLHLTILDLFSGWCCMRQRKRFSLLSRCFERILRHSGRSKAF